MAEKYVMLPLPDGIESMTKVMLKGDPYEGIIYQYGLVKPTLTDDGVNVSFQYEVFENPSKIDTDTKEFRDLIFEILLEIVQKACK